MTNIKELRNKTKLSQKNFADKYHINISTLRHWEQGVQKVPDYYIMLLEKDINSEYAPITRENWKNTSIKKALKYSKEKNISLNSLNNIFTTPIFDDYESFKTFMNNYLNKYGEKMMAYSIIKGQLVKTYWYMGYYRESLYLLDILDTYCNRHNLPLLEDLKNLRHLDRENLLGEDYDR